jgi:hypothetical protein
VRLATHALYRSLVEGAGLEFWPLAGDPHALSAHMVETGGRLLPLSAQEVGGGEANAQAHSTFFVFF